MDDERTSVYIGESENFKNRIGNHLLNKDFWQWAIICVAQSDGLDKAKVKFLESHACQKAIEVGRFEVKNKTSPVKNLLHEFTRASVLDLFDDFELLINILGFNIFEPFKIESPEYNIKDDSSESKSIDSRNFDTIVCPAKDDGLNNAFIAKNAWWAVRIGTQNIDKLKYIALYESKPISAIRYYAKITSIEPYPDKPGKYIVKHNGDIKKLDNPVSIDANPELSLYGPRYYLLKDILSSKTLAELTDKTFKTSYKNQT